MAGYATSGGEAMRHGVLIGTLLWLYGLPVAAQPTTAGAVDDHLKKKEYVQAVSASINNCQTFKDRAVNVGLHLDERAIAATQYVDCLQYMRGYVGLSAAAHGEHVRDMYAVTFSEAMALKAKQTSEKDFMGMSFGIGIGFSRSSSNAVESAQIINNVVTVTSEKKQQARVFLESHYFLERWCNRDPARIKSGCGPFMAIATSSNDIAGAGFGWMFGYKPDVDKPSGYSFGVGLMLDNKVKDLAAGFKAGEPPPAGATTVLTEEKARWSRVFFVTRTF
jgi:hypothetical protein